MADTLTNTTTNAAIVPEIWSRRFYEVLLAQLPFVDSITKEYQGEIASLGDILNISSIPEFDQANVLGEGSKGDADAVTVTGQQLTINYRPYKDVVVTKEAQIQSLPFMDALREKMVYAINKKIQALIISLIVPSAAAPDHAIAYDSGSTLALADILEAKELLDTANVPDMDRVAVLGAAQYNDLFNISGFVSRDFIPAGSPLSSGAIAAPVAGFAIKQTTVVGNTSYWFHPSFMAIAVQEGMNIGMFDLRVEGVRGTRITADTLLGIKQLDNKRVVTIS